VREVLDLALGDRLFGDRGPDRDDPHLLIVADVRRAVDAAGGVGPEAWFDIDPGLVTRGRGGGGGDAGSGPGYNWFELQQSLVPVQIYTTAWFDFRRAHAAVGRIGDELPDHNFWDRLFGVYAAGRWPCGWQGVWWPTRGRPIA